MKQVLDMTLQGKTMGESTWDPFMSASVFQIVVRTRDSEERLQDVLIEEAIWMLGGVIGEHGWDQDVRGCCDETGEGAICRNTLSDRTTSVDHEVLTKEVWILSHAFVEAHSAMVDDHVDVVIGSLWVWLSVEKLRRRQSLSVHSRHDITYLLELRQDQI